MGKGTRKSLDFQGSDAKSPQNHKQSARLMKLKMAGEPISRESQAGVSVGSQIMPNSGVGSGIRNSQRGLNTLGNRNKLPPIGASNASPNSLALVKAQQVDALNR